MELVEAQTQRSRLVEVSGVWSLLQGCLRLDRFQRLPQYSQALSYPLVMCVWALFKHRLGTGMLQSLLAAASLGYSWSSMFHMFLKVIAPSRNG